MPAHSTTRRPPRPDKPPVLHPYVRISDPTQRKGGGLERQPTPNLEGFCRQFGFTLSKKIWVDDGVSAFKGLNATPNHQLGQFLMYHLQGVEVLGLGEVVRVLQLAIIFHTSKAHNSQLGILDLLLTSQL